MGKRHGVDTRLGELEAVVMGLLWTRDASATVRDVLVQLQESRTIAYTTVMTVMDNLHRKGWLRRHMDGRAWRYLPAADREDFSAMLLAEALAFSDNQEGALLRFVEQMSESETEALNAALRRFRATRSER
jgi:predicted transcriptional regulator